MTNTDEPTFLDRVRAPKAELPGGSQRWIEESFQLLIEHFGTDPLGRPAVVPDEFVPPGYDGSEEAARALCLKVCERMGVPSERIRFSFRLEDVTAAAHGLTLSLLVMLLDENNPFGSDVPPETVAAVRDHSQLLKGLSGSPALAAFAKEAEGDLITEVRCLAGLEFLAELVRCTDLADGPGPEALEQQDPHLDGVERGGATGGRWLQLDAFLGSDLLPGHTAVMLGSENLADPTQLLAAVSHELGHEVLVRSEVPGAAGGPLHEPLTDLYAVFHGFGIAQVNASVDEATIEAEWIHTSGYLGEQTSADALAAYRFHQHQLLSDGPLVPAWHEQLDPEPRARFLARLDELSAAGRR